MNTTLQKSLSIVTEQSAYIWHQIFTQIKLPRNGVVIEVAPGYEPKIGKALYMLGFKGTIFLIEPDHRAAASIFQAYKQMLPNATVRLITGHLQDCVIDIPNRIDAVVASHPFDDMVIETMAKNVNFFTEEKNNDSTKQIFYTTLNNNDYALGIKKTTETWINFIKFAHPKYFIASQYPSRTLIMKALLERQESGFAVLRNLKKYYKNYLTSYQETVSHGFKSNPKWWIVTKNPAYQSDSKPDAIRRLGNKIFIKQEASKLSPKDYEIVYADKKYFEDTRSAILDQMCDFAITTDNKKSTNTEAVTTYVDLQKDKTGIALDGNLGSGRAVYYKNSYNILGVGKTKLCKSRVPTHSSGHLDLVSAIRRLVISRWINALTLKKRVSSHIGIISLKQTEIRKWSPHPIPLALLVRLDEGSLDRPSHIEQSPEINIDFYKTVREFAELDAECFAYRFMLGAWSTSNYSLSGHIIDLESVSFTKYRGPYYTSTSKYPHNRFGYETLGLLKVLRQLANIKNIDTKNIKILFNKERRIHLEFCLLILLGIDKDIASKFLSDHKKLMLIVSSQFENLSKKINYHKTNLKLYENIQVNSDPTLLDMSRLFKNLANLYSRKDKILAEKEVLRLLIRKPALSQIKTNIKNYSDNQAESYLKNHALITRNNLFKFKIEIRDFISNINKLLNLLDYDGLLSDKNKWNKRLRLINKNRLDMFKLNRSIKKIVELYRLKIIDAITLENEINKLCN